MQNYTDNANGDVPLIVENAWYFNFIWDQGAHMFLWEQEQNFYVIPAGITCSNSTIEVLEQGIKYV